MVSAGRLTTDTASAATVQKELRCVIDETLTQTGKMKAADGIIFTRPVIFSALLP